MGQFQATFAPNGGRPSHGEGGHNSTNALVFAISNIKSRDSELDSYGNETCRAKLGKLKSRSTWTRFAFGLGYAQTDFVVDLCRAHNFRLIRQRNRVFVLLIACLNSPAMKFCLHNKAGLCFACTPLHIRASQQCNSLALCALSIQIR